LTPSPSLTWSVPASNVIDQCCSGSTCQCANHPKETECQWSRKWRRRMNLSSAGDVTFERPDRGRSFVEPVIWKRLRRRWMAKHDYVGVWTMNGVMYCFWMNPDSIYLIRMVVLGVIAGKWKIRRLLCSRKGQTWRRKCDGMGRDNLA
jgi:hypothetical protein